MKIQCPKCSIINNIDETETLDKGKYVFCKECKSKLLIGNNSGICPNCGHNRKIHDTECATCGITYEKYQEYLNKRKKVIFILSFSLCLLFVVYFFLILPKIEEKTKQNEEIRIIQERKENEETRLKAELKLKEETEKKLFNDAYAELIKIESATINEIILQKYINLLNSAIYELNLVKDNNSIRLDKLNQILGCYQNVYEILALIDENDKKNKQQIEYIKKISKQDRDNLSRNYNDQIYKARFALDIQLGLIGQERNPINVHEKKSELKSNYYDYSTKASDVYLNAQEELENKKNQEISKIINDNSIEKAEKEKSIQLLWKKASELLRDYEKN
jgi:hypothetical protein